MCELTELVERARCGDLNAFIGIVRRFEDMAVGYACSILGDFGLAEDAAQEAFLQAYHDLKKLRRPRAFPTWFRRIVFTQCHRILRRREIATIPLEKAAAIKSKRLGPAEQAEMGELRQHVLAMIRSLRREEREVTSLFYINGYSHKEVAEFLGVPVSTVKSRLHTARSKLKERTMDMVADALRKNAPDPDRFSDCLVFRWKLDTGTKAMCLYGNRALVACENTVLLARRQGEGHEMPELTAIDAETGAIRWSRPCWIECFEFAEALDGGTFYIGDADGACLALNVQDGSVLWRNDMPEKVVTAVALDAERVYFGAGRSLCALDRRDGSIVWKVEMPNGPLIATPMATGDGTVTVLDQHNVIQAHAADSGDLLWTYALDTTRWALLLPSDRIAYAAADDGLYALDRMSGELRWRKDSFTGMIYDRDARMPFFRLVPTRFAAFDESTGEPKEVIELPMDGTGEIRGDRVHLVDDNSYFAISKSDHALLWQFAADSSLHDPAVVGQFVYVLSVKGTLYAFPGPAEIRREKAQGAAERLLGEAEKQVQAGKPAEAVANYRKVIEDVEPGSPDAWFGLALAQEESGSTKDAARAWGRCLALIDSGDDGLATARQHLAALDGALWVNKSHAYTHDIQVNAGVLHVFGEGKLLLMDVTTGDELGASALGNNLCSLAARFADDLILAPLFAVGVRALDRETLTTRWEVPTGAGVCNVAVAEGAAYVTRWNCPGKWEGGGVAKVDLVSGEVIWQRDTGIGWIGSPPTIAGDMVFVSFAERTQDGGICALNAADGAVRWVRRDPPRRMSCQSSIVHLDGVLYVGADHPDAAVYAFDAKSGEIIWRRGLRQPPRCGVMACGDSVYAADEDTLYCIDILSGQVRWECSDLAKIAWLTHIEHVGDCLLLGSEDTVHVVDFRTGQALPGLRFEGQRLWQYCVEADILYVALENCVKALALSSAIGQSDPVPHQR